VFGGSGNDRLYGDGGADSLDGGDQNDTIYGGDGNDALRGRDGNDVLSGDAGNDVIFAGEGNDIALGGADDDSIFGEGGDDSLYGQDGNDRLFGSWGSNLLDGGDGADTLVSVSGGDTLRGGEGGDHYDILFIDFVTIIETGTTGRDMLIVPTSFSIENMPEFESLTYKPFYASEGVTFVGNGSDNVLEASDDWQDTLIGGGGDDTLIGGFGNDAYYDAGAETWRRQLLQGDAGNDFLYGGGHLIGGSGNDTLDASFGSENAILDGGSGNDLIKVCGYLDSEINLGSGNDTVVLVERGFGEDPIIDINGFDPANDVLDLSGLDANAVEPGDQAFTIIGPDEFVEHTVQTIGYGFFPGSGVLWLKLYNSLGEEDVFITLGAFAAPTTSSPWIIL
jgi:Ca2+-binding RTX toxin-like protein